MAGKTKTNRHWQNIKSNLAKRLDKAKRLWKSENYIKDLELKLSKTR